MLQLQAHLVRQIRLWRPEVLVTGGSGAQGADPLDNLIQQAVLQAVVQASDPKCFAEQIAQAGLTPWQAKRIYAMVPAGSRAPIELPVAQLATRLGRSLADVAAMPRSLIHREFDAGPSALGFRLLQDILPGEYGRRDFFSGMVLQPGDDARRTLSEAPTEQLDLLRRLATQRRTMQAILEQTERSPQRSAQLLVHASELTRQLEPEGAGRVLYHLAQTYCRSGQWPMAAETLDLLVQRCPDHPLCRPALLWLLQYYASEEAAWRIYGGQRVANARGSAPALDVGRQEDRPGRAVALGNQIERTRPDLFAEPALQFPLAAATRKQGNPKQAERCYLAVSRGVNRDAWWACAQGELWLANPRGEPPKPVVACVRAATRPRLDGRLDDAVWREAKPAVLHSPQLDDADWPATVMLAYDREFLYVAVQCACVPGAKYEAAAGPRPRDADLTGHDRVELLLDVDRDYATYYRLAVDHRGWTAESCWGDRTWDPVWFVAAAGSGGAWTAEAAIPLEHLTGRFPQARDAWAIGIQRVAPRAGFQSFSAPAVAAVVMPEGFGYLIFE